MDPQEIDSYLEAKRDAMLKELAELLAFRSISMDPARDQDCRACAEWLAAKLGKLGFACRLLGDYAKPALFAELETSPKAPTLLYYGHYDVQPPGDEAAWRSPPFEMDFRDGRVFGRGAVDNKGQTFYFLKSLEWLRERRELELNVKIILEGEEETGSAILERLLRELPQGELSADAMMVCDTGMLASGEPCLMIGLRGIAGLIFEVVGPSHELHSGYHGSLAPNPARALCRMLASLHDDSGAIAVPGYYDPIPEIEPELKELINRAPFDAALYEQLTGVPPLGEPGFSPAEKVGLRPSIDIHTLASGHLGPGLKTIIPPSARAALSLRLARGQDPEVCLALVEEHLRRQLPAGLKMKVIDKHAGGPALLTIPHMPELELAARCLKNATGRDAILRCHGASIPIIPRLAEVSGATAIIAGFSHESDNLHGIDESFAWERLAMGFKYCVGMLRELPLLNRTPG